MNRAFRIIKLIFLGLSILLCLSIPVAGIVSAATTWEGVCAGFIDSQHSCSWWEYAGTEMFWASFLFVPLLFVATIIWLVIAGIQFIAARMKKQKENTNSTTMSL